MWRTHSCVPCPGLFSTHLFEATGSRCRHECRHGTQECARHVQNINSPPASISPDFGYREEGDLLIIHQQHFLAEGSFAFPYCHAAEANESSASAEENGDSTGNSTSPRSTRLRILLLCGWSLAPTVDRVTFAKRPSFRWTQSGRTRATCSCRPRKLPGVGRFWDRHPRSIETAFRSACRSLKASRHCPTGRRTCRDVYAPRRSPRGTTTPPKRRSFGAAGSTAETAGETIALFIGAIPVSGEAQQLE